MDVRHAGSRLSIIDDFFELRSAERTQFIDLTDRVRDCLRRSAIERGLVQIQVLHTTAAVLVNENEPRLLEDFKGVLERLAPGNGRYAHNDLEERGGSVEPGERPNGHAHARALLLGSSVLLNVRGGELVLGRWQSIFLVELDGPRDRMVALTMMGQERTA
ncbi:MAG TPA: secondary thiamine-phosphate synthase enzyme YjbQ [Candidatus Saccharimonadales bacterium]|nr:secondary thiamine-phosphate synthase enzyme YjbQ [Candidatus Saccharimonadales bacterium]